VREALPILASGHPRRSREGTVPIHVSRTAATGRDRASLISAKRQRDPGFLDSEPDCLPPRRRMR
jgi:hypothetical protein